ncbi:MAG: UPF0489 family protein [Cyclobacteriaceae bacterium]
MKKLVDKGFGDSLQYHLNLLYQKENIYVMDNHLAALWCWMQQIDKENSYHIIHIDAHEDTVGDNLGLMLKSIPANFAELTIDEFCELSYSYNGNRGKVVSWNNYLPIFDRIYRKNINRYSFITHELGEIRTNDISKKKLIQYNAQVVFDQLYNMVEGSKNEVIINLDIDYFFRYTDVEGFFQAFTDQAIKVVIDQLIDAYFFSQKVKVFTIALSPECCGGWSNALRVYNQLAQLFHLDEIHMS